MNCICPETQDLARRMAREERRLAVWLIQRYGRPAWLAWRDGNVSGLAASRGAVARLLRVCR